MQMRKKVSNRDGPTSDATGAGDSVQPTGCDGNEAPGR